MEAQIVTIGEELLSGATLDTNSRFLAETLHRFGIRVRKIVTVGDELEGIVRALREAAQGAELVLVTGGLGPTPDDRTREAAAEAFDLRLLLHEDYLRELKEKFAAWGLTFTETDEAQAQLPEGAEIIPNPLGLCGFRLQVRGCHLFFFPGVPKELRSMVQGTLIPFLSERSGGETVLVRLLKCFGPTESQVKELLEGLSGPFELAFLPSFPEIHLRLTVRGGTPEEAAGHLSAYEAEIRRRLGLHLFGSGDDTMEKVVGQLLRERGATIATAESCTGGLVAHRITEVPGSSDYFQGGVVSYSEEAKGRFLGVPREVLGRFGAVSAPCAEAMAKGVRERFGTTFGVSTTGVAGPTGGTPEHPVGTVFIGMAVGDRVEVKRYRFFGDRSQVKLMASEVALDRVRRFLLRNPDFRP